MKKVFPALLLLVGMITSCEQDELLENENSTLAFQGNNAVIRANDLSNLRFKDLPGSITLDAKTPQGEIRVEASEKLDELLDARFEGGELRLEGRENLPGLITLNFHINPVHLSRIVVEGNNKMHISGTPVLDHLELVTEGGSELVMQDLKVRNLKSRREGKSRMFLSSLLTDFKRDSVFFLASTVQVLDGKHLIYTADNSKYLLVAPQIKVRNDSVFALGNQALGPLRSLFITQAHELVNQGETRLDALELPTFNVISKNEGKSESKVWAVQHLQVKGEGESLLYYFGSPQVDQHLQGAARLIRWP